MSLAQATGTKQTPARRENGPPGNVDRQDKKRVAPTDGR